MRASALFGHVRPDPFTRQQGRPAPRPPPDCTIGPSTCRVLPGGTQPALRTRQEAGSATCGNTRSRPRNARDRVFRARRRTRRTARPFGRQADDSPDNGVHVDRFEHAGSGTPVDTDRVPRKVAARPEPPVLRRQRLRREQRRSRPSGWPHVRVSRPTSIVLRLVRPHFLRDTPVRWGPDRARVRQPFGDLPARPRREPWLPGLRRTGMSGMRGR